MEFQKRNDFHNSNYSSKFRKDVFNSSHMTKNYIKRVEKSKGNYNFNINITFVINDSKKEKENTQNSNINTSNGIKNQQISNIQRNIKEIKILTKNQKKLKK